MNFKKMIFVLAFVFGVSSFAGTAFSKTDKVMYVDLFKVFNEYKKTKEYDEQLEKRKEEKKESWEEKQEQIKEMQDKAKLLSKKEKENMQEKINEKRRKLLKEKRSDLLDLRKDRDEKMEEILQEIKGVIEDYARKNKFDMIVKKAAVVYGDDSLDKTDEILKIINN